MDRQGWLDRWTKGDTGFHQEDVHDYLASYWPPLGLAGGSDVLVPLCGKSHDMVWLAGLGHRVIGIELSPVAIDRFFEERGIEPRAETVGSFTVKRGGPYEMWCGDFFEVPAEPLRHVAGVYDRAALVALPPDMQVSYARKMVEIVPAQAPMLIVGLSYPAGEISGPPFSTPLAQVAALFGPTHSIAIAEARDGLEQSQNLKARGLTALEETAYILRRH